jgi:hypothetical protein
MARFRARWDDDDEPIASAPPALRAVSRSVPARPRWRRLYGTVIAVSALGVIAHVLIPHPLLRAVGDAGCALTLLTVLVAWVRMNRVALARLDEPDAGIGTPRVRIVRSRPRASDDDKVHLPFDFR